MHKPREVVVSGRQAAVLDLPLARRGTINVTVLDPVEDALLSSVCVRLLGSDGSEIVQTSTGPDGTARFVDVRVGTYTLVLEAPEGFRCRDASRRIAVTPGLVLELEFELERSGVVKGRVVDQDTGEPLEGVRVRLFNHDGSLVRETTSRSGGEYEFANLPEDRYEIEVDA